MQVSTTHALCDDHDGAARATSGSNQMAQVLLFLNPRVEVMLDTGIIFPTLTCKLLVPAFVMDVRMVEADGLIKEMLGRRMVSAEIFSAHFLICTCLRHGDMPLFKGGGMLGFLCYNYLLS